MLRRLPYGHSNLARARHFVSRRLPLYPANALPAALPKFNQLSPQSFRFHSNGFLQFLISFEEFLDRTSVLLESCSRIYWDPRREYREIRNVTRFRFELEHVSFAIPVL